MFDNLKIAITDEVQLKAVCDVLESMGYKETYKGDGDTICILTDCCGGYSLLNGSNPENPCTANLTDLLSLRDKQFMEKIHA